MATYPSLTSLLSSSLDRRRPLLIPIPRVQASLFSGTGLLGRRELLGIGEQTGQFLALECGAWAERIMDHTGHRSHASSRVYVRRADAFEGHAREDRLPRRGASAPCRRTRCLLLERT